MKQKNHQSIPKAYDFFDNNFGMVVTFEDIQNDPSSFSSVFCEGSVALRELLLNLWEHGIETRGCCKGHEEYHIYLKQNIFGNYKRINQEEYLAHANSKRYHDTVSDEHAYIAFNPEKLGEAETVRNRIELKIKETLPEFAYSSNAFPELVTIGLKEYVEAPERERFFYVLSEVFSKEFFQKKEINKAQTKTFADLNSLIEDADTRAGVSDPKENKRNIENRYTDSR